MSFDEFLSAIDQATVRQVFETREDYEQFWVGIEEGTRAQSQEYDRAHRESELIALRGWQA